jgi:3-deoxy-D-manno-octulosonic-acid transferase
VAVSQHGNNASKALVASAVVIRPLYSLLMWLAQPLLRRKLVRRSQQEPGYAQAIDERFGHYAQAVPAHDGPTVWIHAVSLGETRAAAVLIAALRLQWPTMRLLLTHGTATGRAEGMKLLQAEDLQSWQPWDTPGAVQRFLTHFKPALGLLMETEVWPNLSAICQQRNMPLVLVNARLSDKSLKQAQRLAWLARPAFAALSAVWAQTAPDAQRLAQLGAPVRGVLGNLKFDAAPDAKQIDTGRLWRAHLDKPVLMLASSREGEELALLQILKAFRPVAPAIPAQVATTNIADKVQWLIVPRHPQRFEAVAALIQTQGFAVSRRSSWPSTGPHTDAPVFHGAGQAALGTVWLGDSLGEMALYYGLADVALLGGSFEPLGGQNLIEAAACHCPLVIGPHTFNFAQAAEQAQAFGAAQRVENLDQALTKATALALDQTGLNAARQAAEQFALSYQGVAVRLAATLSDYWLH